MADAVTRLTDLTMRAAKAPIRAVVLAILGVPPVATATQLAVGILVRVMARVDRRLRSLHRNLPRLSKMVRDRRATKCQVAAKYFAELGELVGFLPRQPKISVLIPIYKVDPHYLREALQSVVQQVYPHWEMCLVDDCSDDANVKAVVDEYARRHPGQVKTASNSRNLHISATSNACLALATGDYVALLDHDDRLLPNALAEMVRYINLHDEPDILYSDECTIESDGDRIKPVFFKPDWSPLLHLTMNYTTHLTVYRRRLMAEVGGFRVGFEGSQDHDLMLRMVERTKKPVVHVPFCLYQWRAHAQSTASATGAKPYAQVAGERAVTEHMARRGFPGTASFNGHFYRVDFDLPTPPPLVSIVIPSKDAPALIARCVESILALTTYPCFEIIVADNGTADPETHRFYAMLGGRLDERFRVVTNPRAFNFGAQVNDGVRAARGDYVVLLNNDTEVLEARWIEAMLGLAQLPEVGPVGAKLLFGDRRIQHAGLALSTARIAEHQGFLLAQDDAHYWNYLNTIHETMGVTAACLMIKTTKYWEVGGIDQVYLPRAYGDVDFCLALRRKGYAAVYTPYAVLFHHESSSRGRSIEYFERHLLLTRRGQELAADPYLNPNFERTPCHRPDPFYLGLDFDRREFALFLDHPPERWRAVADELKI